MIGSLDRVRIVIDPESAVSGVVRRVADARACLVMAHGVSDDGIIIYICNIPLILVQDGTLPQRAISLRKKSPL